MKSNRSLRQLGVLGAMSAAVGLFGAAPEALASGGEGARHAPEIPHLIFLLQHFFGDNPFVQFLVTWQNQIMAFAVVAILTTIFSRAAAPAGNVPNRFQSAVESIVEWLDNFMRQLLGDSSREFLPFLGTLFLYILGMNLAGIVPGMKSPSNSIITTGSLALCVFVVVQTTALRKNGVLGFLRHLAGDPKDAVGWMLSPLLFVLHVIGEIVKPVSLALRLFGNITGEDILLGVFLMLGVMLMNVVHVPIGVPFHFPFMLLALIFSTVQALVFTLLAAIYIVMVLPHEHHDEAHHAASGASH